MQKGYRVYDPISQKITYSRNVKFNEHEKETTQVEEESTSQCPLILDVSNIDESELVVQEESTTEDHSSAESQEPVREPRRSTRERRPVDYYGFPQQAHLVIHDEPTTQRKLLLVARTQPSGVKLWTGKWTH